MRKRFLAADEFLADCWELARRIHASGWRPTHMVGVWRGGAPVAVAVQEWLACRGVEADHCAVRTRSYHGIGDQATEVIVDGLDYLVGVLGAESRLLLLDDIHDTGKSLAAVVEALRRQCGASLPREIRRATVYYHPGHDAGPGRGVPPPDYHVHETDCWVVFPHELAGLTGEEIARYKPASQGSAA